MTRTGPGRLDYLDGIRALAIGAVVAVHWIGLRGPIFRGGYVGVDLFFVLSGYVITRLLLASRPSYGAFMARRLCRLYPALLGLVVVCVGAAPLFGLTRLESVNAAVVTLTQTSSPARALGAVNLGPLGIAWSLAVEWYFYTVWPLVVAATWDKPRPRSAALCLGAAAALYLPSLLLPAGWFYFGPSARSAELLVGAAIAYHLPRLRWSGSLAWTLAAAAAVYTAAGPPETGLAYRFVGLPLACSAAAALIIAGADPAGTVARQLSRLAPLGRASYSLYLWHYAPLIALTTGHWRPTGKATAVAAAVLTATIGTFVSYRWLEQPFLKGRARRPSSPETRSVR